MVLENLKQSIFYCSGKGNGMRKQDKKKLPIGIDHFEKLRRNDFYYVDKTGLIKEVLNDQSKVKRLTRPRRFGKSLNISMLENFFSIGKKQEIFRGLKITNETAICKEYMGEYPVISISLKNVNATSFESAFQLVAQTIAEAAEKVQFLMTSGKLTEDNKKEYRRLLEEMSEAELSGSLKKLTYFLSRHYGIPVILLIDEYDVPLANAYENGYYERMALLIRNLFERVLKGNENLKFAVLTGCMQLPEENLWNGSDRLQNLYVSDIGCDEYFGFTDEEVRNLLFYYQCSDKYHAIKEWYQGYQFGAVEVYCPWDIICYCARLRVDQNAQPESYWINTSNNDIVRKFLQESLKNTDEREAEKLVQGEAVVKEIYPEWNWFSRERTKETMWDILYRTGYLTQRGKQEGNIYNLAIPNREIGIFFVRQIMEHFKDNVSKDRGLLKRFYTVLERGDVLGVQECMTGYLEKMVGIQAAYSKNGMEEKYYQELLLEILQNNDQWVVETDQCGDDTDILIKTEERGVGILIVMKYIPSGKLDSGCKKVVKQISGNKHRGWIETYEIQNILKYGIACYKKQCRVEIER